MLVVYLAFEKTQSQEMRQLQILYTIHYDRSVYVSHSLPVINATTNKVITTVPIGGNWSIGIAITPDGKNVYVGSTAPWNIVSVINTSANTVTAKVKVGTAPEEVVTSPDGKKVYVANYGDFTISVIDTAKNEVTATIDLKAFSRGIAVSSDGKKLYVANYLGNNYKVSVIDTTTNLVTSTINLKAFPQKLSVTPNGKNVYVTSIDDYYGNGNNVTVIDTVNNTLVATVRVGSSPYGVTANNVNLNYSPSKFDWLTGTIWQIRDFDGRVAKERADNGEWVFYAFNKAGAYIPSSVKVPASSNSFFMRLIKQVHTFPLIIGKGIGNS
jgi:YVTN family beta-propeller protein